MSTSKKIWYDFHNIIRIVSFLLIFVSSPVIYADEGIKHDIVIGRVSDNPQKHYKKMKPMADYLAKHLKDMGINNVRVLLAANGEQMAQYMRQGKVDIATETAFLASYLRDKAGAEPILKTWRKGAPSYHTVFFVRKDSGINNLIDLMGKTIAFEEPRSTSAYIVPASVFIQKGFKLIELSSPREQPPSDKIGYVFSGEEINSTMLVHKRLVQAAAFSNLDWASDDDLPKAIRNEMRIIYKTKEFPRALELVRKSLNPVIKERIKYLLLKANKDPEGVSVLREYHYVTKFTRLEKSDHEGLDEAAKLREIVKDNL